MAVRLDSRDNPRIKQYIRLQSSAKTRQKLGLFVIEGARLCIDALESGIDILELFYTEEGAVRYCEMVERLSEKAPASFEISDRLALQMTDTKHPQGIFCTCRMLDKPAGFATIGDKSRLIALEDLQDPANCGAILRTAEAVGIDGAVFSSGCCDPFSPKALRASMGAVFRLPIYQVEDLPAALQALSEKGMPTLAAVPDADAVPVTQMDFQNGAVAVIGNEGNGLSPFVLEACNQKVTIPMKGRAESLNASMAACILLWEMLR